MTDPKTSGPGDDGNTVARPGLRDKAQEVLARGSGDGQDASKNAQPGATERIPPVPPANSGPVTSGPVKSAPASAKPAQATSSEQTRSGLPRQASSSVDEQTQTMSQVRAAQAKAGQGSPAPVKASTPPPAAPAAPERPLFADAQRPQVKGAPAGGNSGNGGGGATATAAPAVTATAVATPATPAAPAAKPKTAPKGRPAPRKARLRLIKVDPWSVMKTSFLLSLAFGVVLFVAVLMIWLVLGAAGVWDSVNEAVKNFDESTTFDITNYLGTSRVLGLTALVAVVDVVLMTALATLTAFLYNMAASLLGGVELTFAEEKH